MMINPKRRQTENLVLSTREVAETLGISERHVWSLHPSGRFPRPFRPLDEPRRWVGE